MLDSRKDECRQCLRVHTRFCRYGERAGVELYAPMRGSKEHDKISMYDFKYDGERNVLICPDGAEGKRVGSKMRFEFSIKKCWRCPKASVCCPGNRSRRFTLDENYELVMRLRWRNQSKEYKERDNKRLQIETLFAFLEKLGVKRARYKGIDRVGIQLYITAITSNLVKTVRLKVKQEKEKIEGANKMMKKCLQILQASSNRFFCLNIISFVYRASFSKHSIFQKKYNFNICKLNLKYGFKPVKAKPMRKR